MLLFGVVVVFVDVVLMLLVDVFVCVVMWVY